MMQACLILSAVQLSCALTQLITRAFMAPLIAGSVFHIQQCTRHPTIPPTGQRLVPSKQVGS